MTFAELRRRIWYLMHRDTAARELEEEMRLHLQLRAELLAHHDTQAATPASAQHAVAAANRRFGNVTAIQQQSRAAWGFGRLDDLANDVRLAVRRLTQRSGVTLAVLAVMAIGIGTTTAMFSAVDAVILRPLPFREANRLVVLPEIDLPSVNSKPDRTLSISDVRTFTDLFSDVAAYGIGAVNLADASNPLRVNASVVTANFFQTLGTTTVRGRGFSASDGQAGSPVVALISSELWQQQYGGRDITGLRITLNDQAVEVIGVLPKAFSFPNDSKVWLPRAVPAAPTSVRVFREVQAFTVVARLAPNVQLNTASANLLERWKQRTASARPDLQSYYTPLIDGIRVRGSVISLQRALSGDKRSALLVLMGATGLLLLVACVNVTNLMLAHATIRQREIALRHVLGATRVRLVRQLLTESVILALAGAACGLAIAPALLSAIRILLPPSLVGVVHVGLNIRVLAFTTVVAVVTGVVFGLWPALGVTRSNTAGVIKSGNARGATAAASTRTRRTLVAAELALTTTLLIAATLMLRSFSELLNTDSGLQASRTGTLELALPNTGGGRADRLRRIDDFVARLTATPGITAAGVVNDLPLSGETGVMFIGIDATAPSNVSANNTAPRMRFLQATGGYFDAMGIRLLSGRLFTAADDSIAPQVAIISSLVAQHFWPGVDAVGQTFKGPGKSGQYTVVGVVSDLRESKLDEAPIPQLYLALHGRTPSTIAIVARGSIPGSLLLRRMTEAVRGVDPSQAIFNVRMMDEVITSSVAPRRTNTILISAFAALSLLLASVGVYAVVSHGVAHRSRELGIRSALGATGSQLVRMISHEMVWVACLGIGVGLAGAWAAAKTLESLVYGVTVHDAFTFAAVPLALLIPTAIATLVPARRASRVNPAQVMQAE